MKTFKYKDAKTAEEAAELLKGSKGAVLAGGTDILNVLKQGALPEPPETLVNIKNIAGLSGITSEDGGLKIGALTKVAEIAGSEEIKKDYPVLAEAAGAVSAPTLRKMGTIAGNICQEVQCWYFRRSHMTGTWFNCMRKGGEICYAVNGDNRYHSIFGGAKVRTTPCATFCPIHTDIPNYMNKLRNKDIDGAAEMILNVNPFAAVTGRVCPHFCENNCNMAEIDEAVAIKNVERYLGDHIIKNKKKFIKKPEKETGKKVAIIGSGPAGLSAAYFLRMQGHNPTVFETMEVAGGTMVLTIPNYRLPGSVLAEEIEFIKSTGIEIKTSSPVGEGITIPQLMKEGYEAVFVAIGAMEGRKLNIPGVELKGVMSGLEFLRDVKLGKKPEIGKKVVVIGGGSVAFDCARSAIRIGAEDVQMVCLESRETMPADPTEVKEGEAEGVKVNPSLSSTQIYGKDGKVSGIECIEVTKMCFKEDGQLELETCADVKKTFEADSIIFAIGQVPNLNVLKGVEGLKLTRGNTIEVDAATLFTGVEGIYAGGDVSTTAGGSVVEAIACGKKAAVAINMQLGGGTGKVNKKEPDILLRSENLGVEKIKRLTPPELPVEERIKSMDAEVVKGVEIEAVEKESTRCLNCGCMAVSPSDIAPALVALNAKIKTTKRELSADEFFAVGGNKTTILKEDEIVTEIEIGAAEGKKGQAFIKFAQRPTIDFAVVNAAAVIGTAADGKVEEARVVLGAVAPVPYRVSGAEAMLKGKVLDEELAEKAAETITAGAVMMKDNPYKLQIAKTLVKRAILACKTR